MIVEYEFINTTIIVWAMIMEILSKEQFIAEMQEISDNQHGIKFGRLYGPNSLLKINDDSVMVNLFEIIIDNFEVYFKGSSGNPEDIRLSDHLSNTEILFKSSEAFYIVNTSSGSMYLIFKNTDIAMQARFSLGF